MQLRFLLSSANHHCLHPFSAAPILFSFSNSFPILVKTQFNKQKSPFQFTNFSVYSKKHNGTNDNRNSRSFNRNRSALRETVVKKDKNSDRGGLLAMEEKDGSAKVGTEGLGFNRKRAEGRDESSKKNLQLKVRKLNPANTTSYVQVRDFFNFFFIFYIFNVMLLGLNNHVLLIALLSYFYPLPFYCLSLKSNCLSCSPVIFLGLILNQLVCCRLLGLVWIHMTRRHQCCCFLTSKESYLMLER